MRPWSRLASSSRSTQPSGGKCRLLCDGRQANPSYALNYILYLPISYYRCPLVKLFTHVRGVIPKLCRKGSCITHEASALSIQTQRLVGTTTAPELFDCRLSQYNAVGLSVGAHLTLWLAAARSADDGVFSPSYITSPQELTAGT